jgi:membrane-associated phospholipid phosphatase
MRENEYNFINNIIKIIDTLGYFGPELLFFISIILLFQKKTLFYVYLFGYFINSIFNVILKGIIKQKRPDEDKHLFSIWLNNGMKNDRHWYDRFGMPSGHSQHVLYSTVFIYLSLKNTNWFIFYLLISLNTLRQRVKYHNHTVSQVIVGAIIGSLIGALLYYYGRFLIKGSLKHKEDDNAPI